MSTTDYSRISLVRSLTNTIFPFAKKKKKKKETPLLSKTVYQSTVRDSSLKSEKHAGTTGVKSRRMHEFADCCTRVIENVITGARRQE